MLFPPSPHVVFLRLYAFQTIRAGWSNGFLTLVLVSLPFSFTLLRPCPSRTNRSDGVIVPLIYSVADCLSLVRAAKFPPVGARGFGSPFPMERFHPDLTSIDYLKQANESILVCVQIETREALEDVENIAAVEGVDVLFVGPFDLGNNIGRPIEAGVMHQECKFIFF